MAFTIPSAGFILTAEKLKLRKYQILEKVNITTNVVGEITSDKKLYLSSENDKQLFLILILIKSWNTGGKTRRVLDAGKGQWRRNDLAEGSTIQDAIDAVEAPYIPGCVLGLVKVLRS